MLKSVINQTSSLDDPTIGLVREEDVFFLVLNRKDNVFDFDYIERINKCLDIVAEAKGARVLITVGSHPRCFSTGFDLKCFTATPLNPFTVATRMILMLKKLLTLPVPTMCVMNGKAVAGGFIFALCHDVRIMQANATIELSEFNIGLPLPGSYSEVV